MAEALVLATVVVPLYTGLLHVWIYVERRREGIHLGLGLAAFAMAAIAAALIAQGLAATPSEARMWQEVQIAAGAPLLIGFLRWTLAFLGIERPRIERAARVQAAAVLIGVAGGWLFERQATLQPVLVFHAPSYEAALTPFGDLVLSGFVFFVGYIAVELALAWRRNPDAGPAFLAYLGFGGSLLHDSARGARLISAPGLLSFGYLVMVVGISAVLIRRFVRSMDEAERLASQLHERLEERGAELHRKEVQLIHGVRLATLGTLAAGVAHEINDPMAFVSSNLNRVEESWNDPREHSDVPEILGECRDGLARLRGTVTELLRLARGSDAQNLPVDLAEVVASVLPLVRAEARYRAELSCDLEPVPAVHGNPGLLAQVALQLLLNAIRSVPEEQTPQHRVQVSTRLEDGMVRLRVRDGGPPMPPELLPHLFDPFASLSVDAAAREDRAPLPPGIRLGLAVTHQIVRRHGGEIDVESGARGTQVTVSFPVREAPPRGAPPQVGL
jgi:signal transduction histidine kinase